MPKAVAHPTDAKLAGRCHKQLVTLAKAEGIKFQQTFAKRLPGLLWHIGRYAHARQYVLHFQFKQVLVGKMPRSHW